MARISSPDLIIAPSARDAHQDHRTIAQIVPTVFRDQLYLAYEIPKWDGDIGRPSVYVPLAPEVAQLKVQLLHKSFPSQRKRDWWDDEVFLGLAGCAAWSAGLPTPRLSPAARPCSSSKVARER